jgi:hypothetical protein
MGGRKAHRTKKLIAAIFIGNLALVPAAARHTDPPPVGQWCYLLAEKGNFPGDDDLLTRVDTGFDGSLGEHERPKGFTGTQGIEALAMRQSDEQLFAADHDVLGKVDEHTGVFTPVSGAPWGPGDGALGPQSLDDADGLSFHPDGRLYASIRREGNDPGPDLLIRVDPETGALVQDAFGPGVDYVVVNDPAREDVDDITFDANGVLWGVTNNDGVGSHLVKIDTNTGATADHKPIDDQPLSPANNTDDIEALAWGDEAGPPVLFGVNNKSVPGLSGNSSRLWVINPETGHATFRSVVGEHSSLSGARDYEGMACILPPHCDLGVSVGPSPSLNTSGSEHTFVVSAARCGEPLMGYHPDITVDPAEDEGGNTCETDGTDANGRCTVTITRDTAGTTKVTAHLMGEFSGEPFDFADAGLNVWLHMGKCLDFPQPELQMPLLVKFTIPDTDPDTPGDQGLTDVTVTDDLPPEYIFQGATAINGIDPTTPPFGSSNGEVVWQFASLDSGTYQGYIFVELVPGLPDGTQVHDTVLLTAEGFVGSASSAHTVQAVNEANARAYGLRADLLGGGILPADPDYGASPDSDVQNPDEILAMTNALPGATAPLVRALTVEEQDGSDNDHAGAWSESKAVEADINIPGVVRVQADSVVARASTDAHSASADASAEGSLVGNLRINGTQYGDISEPTTIVINDPLDLGAPFIEVRVLEREASGAAAGIPQPQPFGNGTLMQSGMSVNGLHVIVHDRDGTPVDEASEIVLAHAEAAAAFASVTCRTGPAMSGTATIVEISGPEPSVVDTLAAGRVDLSATGGHEEWQAADIDLPAPVGTIDVATSRVEGSRNMGAALDGSQDTGEAHAIAQVAEAHLLMDSINARAIEARADCDLSGCTGDSLIAELVLAGTNLCNALGLASTCEPAPNTEISLPAAGVLVRLNEQIQDAEPHGLTVNAIHVFVLGEGNPMGLPVGAEILIGSVRVGVRPSVILQAL